MSLEWADCPCPVCTRHVRAWRTGGARFRAAAVGVFAMVAVIVSVARAEAHTAPADRSACAGIVAEFERQGASPAVAQRFGRIAWRESGCVPQYVRNRTDHSHSTLGLNGKGRLRAGWIRLCGHDVTTWAGLDTDVRCALAAYRAMGWRPWAVR